MSQLSGVNYNLFYNSVEIGSLEMVPRIPSIFDEEETEFKEVNYYAQILHADLLPHEELERLHYHLTRHDSRGKIEVPIEVFFQALTRYNWGKRRKKNISADSNDDYLIISGFGRYSIQWLLEQSLLTESHLKIEKEFRIRKRQESGLE